MGAPWEQPRHALLPDRGRSRAVLVGSSAGLRHWLYLREPEEAARSLALALTSSGPDGAFDPKSTTLLLAPERPADVLDAVRHAAEEASDVLLFCYAGHSFRHDEELTFGVMDTDRRRLTDTSVGLDAVAEIMSTSQATRPVVILDCDHADMEGARFTGTAPAPSLFAACQSSFWPTPDPFIKTLVAGLRAGVQDGPEVLDLVTLQNAIEADYARTRYYVENEYIGAPSRLLLQGGRELALGINPAFGDPNSPGTLPFNSAVVDEQEA